MTVFYLLYQQQQILIKQDTTQIFLPQESDICSIKFSIQYVQNVGLFNGDTYYAAAYNGSDPMPGFVFHELRSLYPQLDTVFFDFLGRGLHLTWWLATHQYCGRCGALMKDKHDERARICESCGQLVFPRISPAVITAIIREDKILLARGLHGPTGMYSLIAGFVDPGEMLEAAVRREIREEVGLEVKNIRYFSSQPWPFPDSLMVGFIADYAGGEIVIDPKEIGDAQWFSKHELPENIPRPMSIAGKLLAWFRQQ